MKPLMPTGNSSRLGVRTEFGPDAADSVLVAQ